MRKWRGAVLVVAMTIVMVPGVVWGQGEVFADDFEYGSPNGWSGIVGWAPAAVGATGQITCYDEGGTVIACDGTGQDGDLRPGVAWPLPRFVDNGDWTVTDNLTNLIWLKNADCFGNRNWTQALADANGLASGSCGLTDGSVVGDWRLPSRFEVESLVDCEYFGPALSNAAGTGQWSEDDAFSGVQSSAYWSSTSHVFNPAYAWYVYLSDGSVNADGKGFYCYVWPVRGGQ